MILRYIGRDSIICLFILFAFVFHTVTAAPVKVLVQEQPLETCYKANVDDVVGLVNKAAELIKNKGTDSAFQQIMDPAGGFVKGELYVFVLNFNGVIFAHGASPAAVGSSALMARDGNGVLFIQEMLKQVITNGQGWIKYRMISPCTGAPAEKQVFFKRAGAYIVGAGYYHYSGI